MPNNYPAGFVPDAVPAGFVADDDKSKAAQPEPTFLGNLKSLFTAKPATVDLGNVPEGTVPPMAMPGSKIPLSDAISESGSLAGLASLGMAGESRMGMPNPASLSEVNPLSSIRRGIGSISRDTSTGELKPLLKGALSTGKLVGGPELYKGLFPDPLASQRSLGAFMNRGYKPTGAAAGLAPSLAGGPAEPLPVEYWQEPTKASTEKPGGGAHWSTARDEELLPNAQQGNAAAQEVRMRLGKRAIVIPRGVQFP